MKASLQTIVMFGFANWVVSICNFILYGKNSGELVLATFLFILGFGGLFIYKKIIDVK